MEVKFGHVTDIFNNDLDKKSKFVIKFTVKGYIEDAIAYPIDTFDEPNIGDPIVVYEIESIFGFSFLYKKLRVEDHTRLKLGNSKIDLFDDGIEITTQSGNDIYINGDGGITIKSAGNINIEAGAVINLKGGIKTDSSPSIGNGKGGFCAIKVCPYTGKPHTTDFMY